MPTPSAARSVLRVLFAERRRYGAKGAAMTGDATPEGLEVLTISDCLRLLKSGCIGRVGFMHAGQPRVLPVNYTADDDGSVVFRTADQSILTTIGARAATFEVDGFDERHRTGWSVCVQGIGREITTADDRLARQLQRLSVITWAPGRRDRWFAVLADEITGRRLPLTASPGDFGWFTDAVS
jgi:nitroimidazol reductase NimA-like FMN-containing flavoprotein (pyridoxamine 5'-phosphate oxidase superfamily)